MNLEGSFFTFDSETGEGLHVEGLSTIVKNLQYWFNELNRENQKLRETNQALQSEHYKDEALAAAQKLAENALEREQEARKSMYRGFPISEAEQTAIREWQRKHDAEEHKNPHSYHGAIGGAYSYTFVPTSIGTSGECYCDICKARAMEEAACPNGHFDKAIYSQYLKEHNGSFEFQEIG